MSRNVEAVSCPSAVLCLAADDIGYGFTGTQHTLTVSTVGSGQGRIAATGIDCGNGHIDCAENYPAGTSVSLTATPAAGSTFSGFGGDCSGATCSVTMSSDHSVSASFTARRTLTVTTGGSGSGTVTGPGIDCGGAGHADCTETYDQGTSVNLAATAASGSTFSGFGGDCSGTSCSLTMSSDHSVSATFDANPPPQQRTLTVTTGGSGSGTVTGPGIDCGGSGHTDCTETYADGSSVTLNAAATSSASTFAGWGGDCSGTGTCSLTMSADHTVSATFDANQPPQPPNTKLKKAIIDQANNSATFKFGFTGGVKAKAARGFQCALVKNKRAKPRWKACKSPKTYRHLKPHRYAFAVRAFDAAGKDPTPAHRTFRIKP